MRGGRCGERHRPGFGTAAVRRSVSVSGDRRRTLLAPYDTVAHTHTRTHTNVSWVVEERFFREVDVKPALGSVNAAWHQWRVVKQQGRAALDKAADPWALGKLQP